MTWNDLAKAIADMDAIDQRKPVAVFDVEGNIFECDPGLIINEPWLKDIGGVAIAINHFGVNDYPKD